jgi:dipeptidyl aminopeptidase/acylaminoacyl peptidase
MEPARVRPPYAACENQPFTGLLSASVRIFVMKTTATYSVSLFLFFSAAFSLGVASAFAAPQDKHPFGLDDYSALRSANAVAVSPEGKNVLFVVRWDGDKGPVKQEWHLVETSGENNEKLALPEGFHPQGFTKEGASLYGSFQLEKKEQLAIVPLATGKPTQIIALPNGIHGAVISPDGTKFAAISNSKPEDPLDDVRHVIENEQNQLYVVNIHGGDGAWWCPELKDVADFAWSEDGTQLAVTTQVQKIGHHDVTSAIFVCSATGARKVADIHNAVSGIAWANGGKDLAFASTTNDVLTPDHLWTVPSAGGAPVDQTPKLDGTITRVMNGPHGSVWMEMDKGTQEEHWCYRNGKLELAYRWPAGVTYLPVFSPFTSARETLAFSVGDPQHAFNVAVAQGRELRKITHEGDDVLAKVTLGDVRLIRWTAKDGTKLEGILTLPANYEAGKKYPFLVFPHGGPEGHDALQFDIFARMLAGLGYVVLQPEYRGSTGYGDDFLQAIYQHFGDRAYSDVDSATDFAVAQGWADPNRLAIFGWSAGGFMTAWTVTQTHRYKAAVEGAGITDWLSFIPTSDIAQVDYDMRWQEKDATPFLQFSAVMHADAVTTPLLILHGEADLRVPTFQGREFFVLLAERGKTVRMVTYPGSPHFPQLAEQRRNVFTEIKDWLAKYNP